MIKPKRRLGIDVCKEAPMKTLWRGAAVLAIVAASAGCTTPKYPIREGEAPRASERMPKPQYPIRDTAQAAPMAPAAEPPAPEPTGMPNPKVESQPLPPPSAGSVAAPASAVMEPTPPPASAAPPTPPPAAPSAASEPTPRAVDHDSSFAPAAPPAPPPRRQATAYAPTRRSVERLSVAGEVVAASGIYQNYEVQKGDHLDALARAFGASRSELLDANHKLKSPYNLRPGQIIKVPVAKAYVAESGDTLSGVARRFDVAADELAELNHISSRRALRSGERIGLPASMHDRGPIRTRVTETEYAEAAPARGYEPGPSYSPPPTPAYAPPAAPAYAPPSGPAAAAAAPPSASYAGPLPTRLAPQAAPLSDSEVSAATHGKFVWPVHGDVLARFGPGSVGQRNDGIDIKAPQGAPVLASAAGEVVYAGDQVKGGFGKLVLIQHADGWFTAYAHLDSISVHMKDQVSQGQAVGQVGMSGDASQPMLHFEIRYHAAPGAKTQPIDPALALPSS